MLTPASHTRLELLCAIQPGHRYWDKGGNWTVFQKGLPGPDCGVHCMSQAAALGDSDSDSDSDSVQ